MRPSTRRLGLTSALGISVLLGAAHARAVEENDKAGPFSANVKVGPAIKASRRAVTQFAMQLELQYGLIEDDDGHPTGYVGFAPQLQLGTDAIIVLPGTFQYDIHLPVENLYIYPRVEAGLGMAPDADYYAFALQPEVGVKYQLHEHFHAGMEPISLAMFFGDPVILQYRIYFTAGADF
jgi:hypothetical protein